MSANRKLQAEIDKVLKKVEEGVEVFDDIWEKVYAAEVQTLKEKYEGDLKKEIKKLQRLRDQIKTWAGSNDVKDKGGLISARKLIESKMEQFKVCERETKTKAYSREGLAREDKADPREIEKDTKISWLQSCIDSLTELNDSLDEEVDKIASGKSKAKAKGDAIEKLENRMMTNRWHIEKMELVIRYLSNDQLEPSAVDSIKEDVDYFIETAADDDGLTTPDEIEFDIYEELNLDSLGKPTSVKSDGALAAAATEVVDDSEKNNAESNSKMETDDITSAKIGTKGKTPVKAGSAASIIGLATGVKQPAAKATAKAVATTTSANATTIAAAAPTNSAGTVAATKQTPIQVKAADKSPAEKKQSAAVVDSKKASTKGPESKADSTPWNPSGKAPDAGQPPSGTDKSAPILQHGPGNQSSGGAAGKGASNTAGSQSPGSSKQQVSLDTNTAVSRALKMSMFFTPPGAENDNRPSYTPRNPGVTHPLFPTQPASIIETAALYEKLPMDSLFLAFYYQQGTYHQYLAAKQLKKHSWRFHKKYMTWFQRHEEPKLTTDEYEEGTYVYFDYESGWCQRIKSEFKFEYCYLEDEM